MSEALKIDLDDDDDRFHRFRLIGWWDQAKLSAARVLVVGAGALGNEIVKNLALLGIGHILVADMDRVENSNLSRSVLYRAKDNGKFKADVATESAREIYPEIKAAAFNGNVVYDLPLSVYRWADLVIGGLDNREARLAINRNCWRFNRPFIDGAIEQIQGSARVFLPGGPNDEPCYECTMSATDWKLLQARRSCNLLSRTQMQEGKTPTTPTISSIIAGVQCQEAVKILHGMETIAGKAWVFDGLSTDAYQVQFQRKPDCLSHETLSEVVPLDVGAATVTLGELLSHARHLLGDDAVLELGRDVLEKLVCPQCGCEERLMMSLGKVDVGKGICPTCAGAVGRQVTTFYKIRGGEDFLDQTPAQIGLPPFDTLIARTADRAIGLELAADAALVLGTLLPGNDASEFSALEWT